jgi:phage gp36-like protein
MYCTRADIESKRLPRQNLLQLTDDEMMGEYDDTATPPPAANQQPVRSDATSRINVRIAECIEDAVNEIHSYLSDRYVIPLPAELAVINTICTDIAVYRLFLRRNEAPDTVMAAYKQAIEKLKLFRDGRMRLPAPLAGAESSAFGRSYVVTTPRLFQNVRIYNQ